MNGTAERLDAGRSGQGAGLVAISEAMRDAIDVLRRVAPSSCTVLVTGESGTGKEVAVRALHEMSPRRNGPLVAVNCGAIADQLVESELFGHARGAFTGALTARRGYVAAAEGGTLFLDEVGELSPAAQVKLLRLLQQREYTPIGETTPVRSNARVVGATNRDLAAEVRAGRFREDLYFRLDVVHVHLAPLRERREEIRPLALHFLETCAERTGRTDVTGFAPGVLELIEADDWPGNVRALENALERAVLLARGPEVDMDCLPARILARGAAAALPEAPLRTHSVAPKGDRFTLPPSTGDGMVDLRAAVDALESRLIRRALEKSQNNKQRAADMLGIKRTTLLDMMKRKGLAA